MPAASAQTYEETAPELEIGVRATVWTTRLSGSISGDGAGAEGDTIDLEDDLDMSRDERPFPIEGSVLLFYDHRVSFDFWSVSYAGDEVIDETFTFEGEVYSPLDRVESTLEIDQAGVRYTHAIVRPGEMMNLRWFEAGIGVKSIAFRGSIETPGASAEEEDELFLPVASVRSEHLFFHGPWIDIGADLRLDGIALRTSQGKGTLFDFVGELNASIGGHWTVYAGYRYFTIDAEVEDSAGSNDLDLTLDGFTFGVGARF